MTIDIDKAMKLRLEGYTHQQVAEELKCSVGWCKANLRGVKQPSKDKSMIDEIRRLGRTKQGVTTGEIRVMIQQQYNLKDKVLQEKMAEVKRVARRDNKDVLIRPYWMIPDIAHECTTTMFEYAHEVYQFKASLADKYRQTYNLDDSYTNAVIYALTAMSAGERSPLLPQGMLEFGAQLSLIQDELDNRNNYDMIDSVPISLEDIPLDMPDWLVTED
jgi:hypothetical protein